MPAAWRVTATAAPAAGFASETVEASPDTAAPAAGFARETVEARPATAAPAAGLASETVEAAALAACCLRRSSPPMRGRSGTSQLVFGDLGGRGGVEVWRAIRMRRERRRPGRLAR